MLRVIPLHSEILRLGFQDFVKNCIKRCGESIRLFPEIVSASGYPRTFSASALLVSFIFSESPISGSVSIVSDIGASNP
jgi:hypothetical protein